MIQKMTEISEKEEKLRHLKQSNRLEELRMGLQIADEAASLMRKNGYSDDEVKSFFRWRLYNISSVLEELEELMGDEGSAWIRIVLFYIFLIFLMKIKGYEIKQGADLEGADLRFANLQDANLEGANLKNVIR